MSCNLTSFSGAIHKLCVVDNYAVSACLTCFCTAGLYGNLVPQTVANFCKAVESGLYTGTLWSKVLPGEYIQAGQQGSRRTGAVDFQKPAQVLDRNSEVLSSKSFRSATHAFMAYALYLQTPCDLQSICLFAMQSSHADDCVQSLMSLTC